MEINSFLERDDLPEIILYSLFKASSLFIALFQDLVPCFKLRFLRFSLYFSIAFFLATASALKLVVHFEYKDIVFLPAQ
jgi:hypothetical protein